MDVCSTKVVDLPNINPTKKVCLLMKKPRFVVLIAVLFLILASCSHAGIEEPEDKVDYKPSKLEEIPFIVYQISSEDSRTAKMGSWDILHSQISFEDGIYSFIGDQGKPLYWRGNTLIVNSQGTTLVQGADHSYDVQFAEAKSSFDEQSYFFNEFTVTGHLDEDHPVYDIQYQGKTIELSLNQFESFQSKRAYLANAAISDDGKVIKLVFTGTPKIFKPNEGWIISAEYNISTSKFTVTEFPGNDLPFGDMIVSPDLSILDGDRLYVWRTRDFGYFDLKEQKFIQQNELYKDIQSFMPDRIPNPNVQPRIIPVGYVGNLLLLYDSTVYFDENTSGVVVYAYNGEKPAGKLLIKGDQLYIYDQNNKQVGTPENFDSTFTRGELISFPK